MPPDRRETAGVGVGVGDQEPATCAGGDTEAWHLAFRFQATPTLFRQGLVFARRCADLVAARGGVGGELVAREMFGDALTDTWLGSVRWDPDKKSLRQHLVDTLLWRVRDTRIRTVLLGSLTTDDGEEGDEEQRSSAEPKYRDVVARLVAPPLTMHDEPSSEPATFEGLWHAAEGDEEVRAILLAHRDHRRAHVKRAAMIAVPTMTSQRYDAARERLVYLRKRFAGPTSPNAARRRPRPMPRAPPNPSTAGALPLRTSLREERAA